MIRFALVLALFLGCASAANATTCTLPNTLTNGTIVDAMALMGNFTSLQACGNNIDTNNIGTTGVYATQIKPLTTLQAIFGGTVAYSFANGLGITGTLAAQAVTASSLTLTTPLAVASGGTGNATGVATNVSGTVAVANGGTGTAAPSLVAGANVTITGPFPNQTVSSTAGGMQLFTGVGAVTLGHGISGTVLFSGVGAVIITLSGAAVYTNAHSYSCFASIGDNNSPNFLEANVNTASQFTIQTYGGGAITGNVQYGCLGT